METIKEIDKIVKWWLELKKGYTNINHLDDVHRKLSGYYYYLCELTSEDYKDYLLSYVNKRVGLAKREQKMIEEGSSATLAKNVAPMHEEQLMMEEAIKEGDYQALKLKVNAVAKVLSAIQQRISNLKNELSLSKRQT